MALELKQLRFLIIDDSLHIRKIIKAVCMTMGVKDVVEADNGKAALDILKKRQITSKGSRRMFDLIICDWMMPEMSGLELLQEVRRNSLLKSIPFLMVTAEHDRELVMQAIKEGVSDYVVKPFTADVLEGKINKVLKLNK